MGFWHCLKNMAAGPNQCGEGKTSENRPPDRDNSFYLAKLEPYGATYVIMVSNLT